MVQESSPKRSVFPVVGGILLIIGSILCSITGAIGLIALSISYPYGVGVDSPRVIPLAVFVVLGFLGGLLGGIMGVRRKYIALVITGAFMVMAAGFVNITIITRAHYSTVMTDALLAGLPIILVSIFGLILTVVSRDEFY